MQGREAAVLRLRWRRNCRRLKLLRWMGAAGRWKERMETGSWIKLKKTFAFWKAICYKHSLTASWWKRSSQIHRTSRMGNWRSCPRRLETLSPCAHWQRVRMDSKSFGALSWMPGVFYLPLDLWRWKSARDSEKLSKTFSANKA